MREAGFDEGRVEIAKPDGTTVSIVSGKSSVPTDIFQLLRIVFAN